MRKLGLLTVGLMASTASHACDVCARQQPRFLRGIAHGAGPDSSWDYVIVALTAIVVAVSLYYSVRWLWRPGETNENHIKRSIFRYD